jgi:dGTPase
MCSYVRLHKGRHLSRRTGRDLPEQQRGGSVRPLPVPPPERSAYDRMVPATATFEDRITAWEEEFLAPQATRSYPARRRVEEPDSPLRTPFQRDRDRIVHSKSFRRLKHKTQVFVAPEGDHYRTRLTHTLEACGIARTVARALALNEDLTEAIGLGHDLGHPPFGHAGEEALDEALRGHGDAGFRHNEHSLRVVEVLERDGRGLNLTEQVRDGILNHTGPNRPATLEGQIVKIVDRIAYINHDIDDALRAGILRPEDLPAEEIELLGPTGSQRIDTLVRDIVEHSAGTEQISQGREVGQAMLRLRKFMFDRVYLGPQARREHDRVQRTMRGLFDHYLAHPEELPSPDPNASEHQCVTDYIAGMTDRFCIAKFTELTIPEESRF